MAFNSFPYVNMHELNLDYLLNKSKEIQSNVEAAAGSASAAASSAAAAAGSADASLTYSRNSANSAAASEASAADSAESARIAVAAAGDPVTFTAASQLTDTSKIYVYIGTTGTYTYGHWYYYANGTWNDGGVYGTWTTDDALDPNSTNAVQNRVIYNNVEKLQTEIDTTVGRNMIGPEINTLYPVRLVAGDVLTCSLSDLATGNIVRFKTHDSTGAQTHYWAVPGGTGTYRTMTMLDDVYYISWDYVSTNTGSKLQVEAGSTATAFTDWIPSNLSLDAAAKASVTDINDKFAEIEDVIYAEKTAELESGSVNTTTGENASDSTCLRTTGYISSNAIGFNFTDCKARVFAYSNGTYAGGYSAAGLTTKWQNIERLDSPVYLNDLGLDNYQLKLVFDRFAGDVSPEIANVHILESRFDDLQAEITNLQIPTYTVGFGKDFSTFTEMLVALKADSAEKIVYVDSGTYDIFTEMGGAAFMSSVDTSKNWREVNNVVPPNTKIIGIGKVVLTWNPTDAQIIDQAHAHLFSPLNLSGTCKIVNISVVCSNCRYGIHDETSGIAAFDGSKHVLERVNVNYTASTYGTHYAYGAGHNKSCTYHYKNCKFLAAYAVPWSMHDWPAGIDEKSSITFDNCVFKDNRTGTAANIRLSSSDQVGRLDDVNINGCYFNTVSFSTEGSSDVKQGYFVTSMLCNQFEPIYTSHILEADRIAPDQYLTI